MSIRTFIAVETGKAPREKLAELLNRLRKASQFTSARPSWVKPENIHITLKFLGNIEEEMVAQIESHMNEIAYRSCAFDVSAGGLGVFPNKRQPRILWLGIKKGKEELQEIQELLERKFISLGFEPERRTFHPHLTLARIKYLKGTSPLMDIVEKHQAYSEIGNWHVDRLILFKSDLHPDGAIYTPIKEFILEKK